MCMGVCTCVFGLIILQSLGPHAEIVNEVSAAYDTALPNILTQPDRERATGRWGQRKKRERPEKLRDVNAPLWL